MIINTWRWRIKILDEWWHRWIILGVETSAVYLQYFCLEGITTCSRMLQEMLILSDNIYKLRWPLFGYALCRKIVLLHLKTILGNPRAIHVRLARRRALGLPRMLKTENTTYLTICWLFRKRIYLYHKIITHTKLQNS